MNLQLVCDVSGSMGEGGKIFAMRTAVMFVARWVRFGYSRTEISLCGWSSGTRHFPDWSTTDEFPTDLLSCSGSSNERALIQWLRDKPEGKILLLTDGIWPRNGAKVLKQWMESLPSDSVRVIKIGADANPQLKGPNVFAAEDLFAALDGWLERGVT